ncbi:uncharacterized protein LOC120354327 [Nilaparvata lugens]|uniref:uncharacterized protein LOC120354327 n=1 Tax=Nilaparvata lugens TaxID=108931 RepID=UPI00193E3698|nr:uncharacterized protein LOC120354327 [Nilaparvata lugens]
MDSRHTVKGKKKLVLSARRMKRRLPPEFHANRRRRIEEQTLSLEAPSSSQADSVSADAISVSTENFQPSATSTPKGKKRRPHNRKVPVHLMKWRLQQKKSKEEEKSGPSTSSSTLESNLKKSVLDGTSDFATIVPPFPSIGLQPALNHEIDTTSTRNSGVSYVESNVCDTLLTRYDEYPDLIVEPDGRPPKDDFNIISGRFIVDGKHLVQELRSLDYHRYECEKSDNGYMTLVSSTSKSSEWTMKFVVWTAPRTSCHNCISRNGRNSSSALRFVVDKEHDFLAASPDGLVGGDNLIEVKCWKSAENLTISEAVIKVKSFCLEKLRCGNVRLKKNHNYYYQVQGQLHVAEKKSVIL